MSNPVKPAQDTVVLINRFFANEQGRDKFNKVIQYGSRYIAYQLLTADPKSEYGLKFNKLFAFTRDCRKILRLFKWLNEYDKLTTLLSSPSTPHSTRQQLLVLSAVGMSAYWFFDNLTYLVKGGMLKDNPQYAKLSMLGWNVGLTCSMIIDTQTLIDNLQRERDLRAALGLPPTGLLDVDALREGVKAGGVGVAGSSSSAEGSEDGRMRQELVGLYNVRLNLLLNFIKNGGDWLISANGSWLDRVLGYQLNDGIVGIAGTVSGLATMTQIWRGL